MNRVGKIQFAQLGKFGLSLTLRPRRSLERIEALYVIESVNCGRLPDERRSARGAHAGPLLQSLREWPRRTLARLSKKSELAKAIGYVLTCWAVLAGGLP